LGGTLCKIGSPLLSFLLCSLCTPLQELFDENKVIGKIDHTAKWKQNVNDKFKMLEVVLNK
jgi:hypothetical protein